MSQELNWPSQFDNQYDMFDFLFDSTPPAPLESKDLLIPEDRTPLIPLITNEQLGRSILSMKVQLQDKHFDYTLMACDNPHCNKSPLVGDIYKDGIPIANDILELISKRQPKDYITQDVNDLRIQLYELVDEYNRYIRVCSIDECSHLCSDCLDYLYTTRFVMFSSSQLIWCKNYMKNKSK